MKFKAQFSIDNSAFEDNADEMPTIIEGIANKVAQMSYAEQQTGQQGNLRDSNGNSIGWWEIIQ